MGVALVMVVLPVPASSSVVTAAWRSVTSYATGDTSGSATPGEDEVRRYEADRLLDEWSKAPVFGHGLGATIQGYERNQDQPWAWELQYHALLFQTGLVGALLLVLGALVTVNAVVRAAAARPELIPALVVSCSGAVGMLIGNASNPYLQAPGHVWSIFLPVAVANVMLLSKPSSRPRLHAVERRSPVEAAAEAEEAHRLPA